MKNRLVLLLISLGIASPAEANWAVRLEQTVEQARRNVRRFQQQMFVPVYAKIYAQNGRLLVDEIWERGHKNVSWDVRVQLTGGEFKALDKKLQAAGYALYCRSSCQLNGVIFHAGVWRKGRLGPVRAIRISEDRVAHQGSAAALSRLGYKPVYVKGNAVGSAIRLDQVWEKRSGAWDMRSFIDAKEFMQHDKKMKGLGYRPIWHSKYRVNRTFLNAAIWHR